MVEVCICPRKSIIIGNAVLKKEKKATLTKEKY